MPERFARTESPDPLDLLNGGEESSDEPSKRLRDPPHTAPVLSKRPSTYGRQRPGGGSMESTSPSFLLSNAGRGAKRTSGSSSEESGNDEDDNYDRARDVTRKRTRTPASARPTLLHTPSASSSKSATQYRRQTSPAKRSNRSSRSSSTVSAKRVVPPPARRAASPSTSDDHASDDDRRRSVPPRRTPTRSPVKQLVSVVIPERPGIRRRTSKSPTKTVRAPTAVHPETDLQLVNEAMEVDEAEVDAGARLGPIPAAAGQPEQDIPLDMAPDWQFGEGVAVEHDSEESGILQTSTLSGEKHDGHLGIEPASEPERQRLDCTDSIAEAQQPDLRPEDKGPEPTEVAESQLPELQAPVSIEPKESAIPASPVDPAASPSRPDGSIELRVDEADEDVTASAERAAVHTEAADEEMEIEERVPDEPYSTVPASSGVPFEEEESVHVQEAEVEEDVVVDEPETVAPSEGEPEIDTTDVVHPAAAEDQASLGVSEAIVQIESTPEQAATPSGKTKAVNKKAAAAGTKKDGKEKGKAAQQKAKSDKKKEETKPSKKAKLDKGEDSVSATPRQGSPAPAVEVEDEGSCGVCGKAWDGEDDEETWIGCEGCDQWFCAGCSGLTAEQIDLVEVFICKTCERRTRQKTTWKVRCKYSECSNIIAGGPSKFCSSSCAFKHSAFLLASIQNKKSIKQLGQDLAAYPAPSLGVSVVNHLPTPPVSPSQLAEAKGAATKGPTADTSPLAPMLEAITKQIESVKAAIQLVHRRQQILEDVISRCEALPPLAGASNGNEAVAAPSSKSSKKNSSRKGGASDDRPCGWERRLIWDDDAVLAAPEPPTPAQEESGQEAVAVEEDGDRVPCLNPRRKCDRHAGWQKTVAALLENEAYQLDTELASLQDERTTLESKDEALRASSTVRSVIDGKLANVRKKA